MRASKQAKEAFVLFVAKSKYDFAWHVEDDTFVSSAWSTIFDGISSQVDIHGGKRDLVAAIQRLPVVSKEDVEKKRLALKCRFGYTDPCWKLGETPLQAYWPLIRVSKRLLNRIARLLAISGAG